MYKQLSFLFVFALIFSFGYTQTQLGLLERKTIEKFDEKDNIQLLFKGQKNDITEILIKYKGTLKYHYKDVGAISIPKSNLNGFLLELNHIQIEIPTAKGHLLMDTGLIMNNVLLVHDGVAPLNNSYTGKDVVVGILDSGIYFDHDDFKNPDGTTRIRYIWDQNIGSNLNAPTPYEYGQEWSWIDINSGSCTHVEPANQFGHGTTVAGAACGNGLANGLYKGVATESEIIVVGVNFQENFLSNVADAVDYIFKKADALGKPCVINTSLGTYSGSHDGKDLTAQLIDALLEERPGRAVVASAGNGNNRNNQNSNYIPFHLGYEVTNDTSFTWFRKISSENYVYFSLWADTADFNNVNFAVGNNNTIDFELIGRTNFLSVFNDFTGNLEEGVYRSFNVFNNVGIFQGQAEFFVKRFDSRYQVEFLITPEDNDHLWRLMTTGSGKFDLWSSQTFTGSSNMRFSNLPPDFLLPEIVHYKAPDNKKTLVSSWQCSDKVITVGNYYSRATYYDVDSTLWQTDYTVGEIAFRSSEGPTRDNRLKPDISATGDITFATGNLSFIASALNVNRKKVGLGGLHNSNGGTSMSSPIVAGAVAMYLEKNPDAWWYEVKEALIQSAKKDNFTGTEPNNDYGHGKLDAFELLKFDAVLGCTNSTAFNYNALANVEDGSCEPVIEGCTDSEAFNFMPEANTDDGSCIEVIFGCTDSLASNYNENANTDDGSCIFVNNIENIRNNLDFQIHPNPNIEIAYISFSKEFNNLYKNLLIYNVNGAKVLTLPLENSNQLEIKTNQFNAGVYFIRFEGENSKMSAAKKLFIQ